jgi:hypothetical protein
MELLLQKETYMCDVDRAKKECIFVIFFTCAGIPKTEIFFSKFSVKLILCDRQISPPHAGELKFSFQ